jgi:hypothetical protein
VDHGIERGDSVYWVRMAGRSPGHRSSDMKAREGSRFPDRGGHFPGDLSVAQREEGSEEREEVTAHLAQLGTLSGTSSERD